MSATLWEVTLEIMRSWI